MHETKKYDELSNEMAALSLNRPEWITKNQDSN